VRTPKANRTLHSYALTILDHLFAIETFRIVENERFDARKLLHDSLASVRIIGIPRTYRRPGDVIVPKRLLVLVLALSFPLVHHDRRTFRRVNHLGILGCDQDRLTQRSRDLRG
jgi:hypothetical protein